MNVTKIVVNVAAGLLALTVVMPQPAKASLWNQKTVFTFNAPVEVPGQVLEPGTYVFKLADSILDRDIVEVYNKDEKHLYGFFLTIPDYHLKPADKPIITFTERAAGAPEAVKAWFYPGDNYGHDFVYPKLKAVELAKVNKEPVASMPNETKPTKAAMKKAVLKAQKPTEEEVDIAEAFTPPPAKTAAALPQKLPKTASPFPLIGLIGLLSLVAAGSLRLLAVKMK